jgi:hypothetical protein
MRRAAACQRAGNENKANRACGKFHVRARCVLSSRHVGPTRAAWRRAAACQRAGNGNKTNRACGKFRVRARCVLSSRHVGPTFAGHGIATKAYLPDRKSGAAGPMGMSKAIHAISNAAHASMNAMEYGSIVAIIVPIPALGSYL